MDHPIQIPAAERMEHLAWLNSPLTREFRGVLQQRYSNEVRSAIMLSLSGDSNDNEIRSHLSRAFAYEAILGLVERLPDAKHETT